MVQKYELTFQKPPSQIEKILEDERAKHKPVDLPTRRIWRGGSTTSRVTEADYQAMVVDAKDLSPLK